MCASGETVYCRSFGVLGEHSQGTLAEKVVIPAANAVPKPPGLPWETAGSFSLATGTAYRMLRRARLQEGETLLVVGVGGGVSSAAALLGVSLGARVFVTSRGPEKIAWAVDNGAEAGFDSGGQFSKELRAAAGGQAHVVVENVGPATWGQALRSLRPGGRMVVCGATSGAKAEIGIPALFFRQLEIIGSTMYTPAEYQELLALIVSGKATPPPVDCVPSRNCPPPWPDWVRDFSCCPLPGLSPGVGGQSTDMPRLGWDIEWRTSAAAERQSFLEFHVTPQGIKLWRVYERNRFGPICEGERPVMWRARRWSSSRKRTQLRTHIEGLPRQLFVLPTPRVEKSWSD